MTPTPQSNAYITAITNVTNKVLKARAAINRALQSPSLTIQEREGLAALSMGLSEVMAKALKTPVKE